MDDQFYTVGETAELLSLSKSRLDNWRSQNAGPPYYKVGKRVLYRWQDIDKFMKERRVEHSKPGE